MPRHRAGLLRDLHIRPGALWAARGGGGVIGGNDSILETQPMYILPGKKLFV